jgi:hypothetical protein
MIAASVCLFVIAALLSTAAGMRRPTGSTGGAVYGLAAAVFWMGAIICGVAALLPHLPHK